MGLELDDNRRIYSDASSRANLKSQSYIHELVDELRGVICARNPDHQTLIEILKSIPELLKEFALKFGHNAPSQMHRDIMVFVHKNRKYVCPFRIQSSYSICSSLCKLALT